MFKLSEKSRKILRMIYRGLGVSTVAFAIACDGSDILVAEYGMPAPAYGMPPDYWEQDITICGVVQSKETEKPIPGIKVTIEGITSFDYTNSDGYFCIYAPRQESYEIKFEDLDGQDNGGLFKENLKTYVLNDNYNYLTVKLELEEETGNSNPV